MSQTSEKTRKRGSGVQFAYETLRTDILNLELAPGSPVDELQLSERLKISRTPIREAMVRLASEGLVSTLPNRSTIVAPIDFMNLHSFFDAIMLMYRVTTCRAAESHRPADIAILREHQAEFTKAVKKQDALRMIETNRDFHAAIADAGRNAYYSTLFSRLLDDGRRLLRLYYLSFEDRLPQQYVDEHDQMIAAIAARDIATCDRLASAHADQIIRQIQRLVVRDRATDLAI